MFCILFPLHAFPSQQQNSIVLNDWGIYETISVFFKLNPAFNRLKGVVYKSRDQFFQK